MKILNDKTLDLNAFALQNAPIYQSANPFPSIYFDDFFNENFLKEVLAEFPDLSKKDSIEFKNKQEIKLQGKGELFFGSNTKKLMHFLNSEPFLNFLQILTGISEPLIGDPYFNGGGQHEIKKGGLLKIHADFNKHPDLDLDRRINVLVYLNENWEESFGGHFELWDKNMKGAEAKILPIFNRMAIFSTTDFSFHGHPDRLNCPDGRSRKSLALYYYSNGRPKEEINWKIGKHTTLFKNRNGNKEDLTAQISNVTLKSVVKGLTPPFLFSLLAKLK